MKRVRLCSIMILFLILTIAQWGQNSWAESKSSNYQETSDVVCSVAGGVRSNSFGLNVAAGGQGCPVGTQSSENYIALGGWVYTALEEAARGDVNEDGLIDLGDAIYLLNYLFRGGPPPNPWIAGDLNCDGLVDLGDLIYLLNYLFREGPPPFC
jgi:hypothetical protein